MTSARLQAGICEIQITPEIGIELVGEFAPRRSTGIATPLMAKALVLSNGENTLAVVSLDLVGLDDKAATRLVKVIGQKTGLAPEAIMLFCSFTRGAPYTTARVGGPELNQAFLEKVIAEVPEAVSTARRSMTEAALGAGHVLLPHLIYNHRLMTRNMKAITAWMGVPKNEVLEPEGPVDPQFGEIVIRDQAGFPICLLWNFPAEIRANGDNLISAGLPGLVQSEVDARLGKHVPVLCLPACASNISFTGGLDDCVDAIASAVIATYLETSCDPLIRLGAAMEKVILPVRDYSQFWSKPDIELKRPDLAEIYQRELELLQKEGAVAIPTSVQVFRLGWFALVGLPGAPFVELALAVKSESPAQLTLVAGGCAGDIGQVIVKQAFDDEGFESWTARSARAGYGAGEFLAEQAVKLSRSLWKGERVRQDVSI